MSKKYRIIGGEDGWSKPVYADEYGNIISEKEVERERLKEEIKDELRRERGGW